MKALQFTPAGDKPGVAVNKVALPVPKAGELLIRVEATPVNPVDQHLMGYPGADRGVRNLGLEGAGIVVGVGDGVDKGAWMDKKVSFLLSPFGSAGSWSQYFTIAADYPQM